MALQVRVSIHRGRRRRTTVIGSCRLPDHRSLWVRFGIRGCKKAPSARKRAEALENNLQQRNTETYIKMGSVCSSTLVTGSGLVPVPVSADIMQSVLMDNESAPNFIPHVVSVEYIKRGDACGQGAVYRETRIYRGRKYTFYGTVTKVQNNPFSMAVSLDAKETSAWDNRDAAETHTFIVQPSDDDNSCTIVWSYAFVSAGFWGTIFSTLCQRRFKQGMQDHLNEEFECYAAEGIRRAEQKSIVK